jgi:hypothetical protein
MRCTPRIGKIFVHARSRKNGRRIESRPEQQQLIITGSPRTPYAKIAAKFLQEFGRYNHHIFSNRAKSQRGNNVWPWCPENGKRRIEHTTQDTRE